MLKTKKFKRLIPMEVDNCCDDGCCNPNPNDFSGTDSERIQKAVNKAASTTGTVEISKINKRRGDNIYLIDSAILLPPNITVIIDNATIKLSDRARDNFFRSANCGFGITSFVVYNNISIIGKGNAVLQGADNPRATGGGKPLKLNPGCCSTESYGTDAGVAGQLQVGDWRNFGILFGYVTDFLIDNIKIVDPHMWAITLERCTNGRISNVEFSSNGTKVINGNTVATTNQDGIDLRFGCYNIIIENITGQTGDDCVALALILTNEPPGVYGTNVCTGSLIEDVADSIRFITIKNIKSHTDDQIVRLLNTGTIYEITDIVIDTVLDNSDTAPIAAVAVIIGDTGYGGVAPLGHTSRVIINNVISRAGRTIRVRGSLSESIITNIIRYQAVVTPGTVLFYDNMANIRNVNSSNIYDYTI